MNVTLTPTALDDQLYWLKTDKGLADRVLALLEEIRRRRLRELVSRSLYGFNSPVAGPAGSTANTDWCTRLKKRK